jgi:hypothetical protein
MMPGNQPGGLPTRGIGEYLAAAEEALNGEEVREVDVTV